MDEKTINRIKKYTIIVIIVVSIYFFLLRPFIQFKSNEKKMLNAVKRYYEVNESLLPTGRRVSTVTLDTLFKQNYIDKDFNIPFTKKVCSTTKSWGKVTKVDSNLKYYVYLDCGILKSNVDHKGPEIILNGAKEITVERYGDFKDPGIKKVYDNQDGKMSTKDVKVTSNINPLKSGVYKAKYTATDSLKNTNTVTRTVKVIETLKRAVELSTDLGYYTGDTEDNYLYFSGNLYRIIGIDGENVKIITNTEIGNVDYNGIDAYLEKFYNSLSPGAQKLVIDNKYCNMKLNDNNKNSKKCSSYTDKRKTYLLSADDFNKSLEDGTSYLDSQYAIWFAHKKDDKISYGTQNALVTPPDNSPYVQYEKEKILGVKPVLTLPGKLLIKSGEGTIDDPYYIGETKKAKAGDKVNSRYSGEFLSLDGDTYRIISTEKDGTTKVISSEALADYDVDLREYNESPRPNYIYDVNEKDNIGYFINNKASKYINGKHFVNHKITVPIYRKNVIYGKEIKTKTYQAKYFAPDAFDLYNILSQSETKVDYWIVNSTEADNMNYIMAQSGNITKMDNYDAMSVHGIRICGYITKDADIVEGSGTYNDPYKIAS